MLENLPDSFLSQLADIDPVIWIVSKKLYKSRDVSCIDMCKFLTSRDRYELAISSLCCRNSDVFKGIKAVMYAKAASGDPEFMYAVSEHGFFNLVCLSMEYAAIHDLPRIIEYCFKGMNFSMERKCRLILQFASNNGSTRVLTWFLENMPEIMKDVIRFISCDHLNTVKWCIENLSESSPLPVNWVLMKVEAIVYEKTECIDLLDWVVVPPCPFPGLNWCGGCPDCMIRNGSVYYSYYF
jgi:hypothetical protein